MAAKIYRHLFYGSDSRRSLQELQRWSALYETKHGLTARYVIEGDEGDVRQRLQQHLQGISLFAEPQLLILKRLSEPRKLTKAQTEQLERIASDLQDLPDGVTVLLFEAYDLPVSHPLRRSFEAAELTAKLHRFQVPDERSLPGTVRALLAPYGLGISKEAISWLQERYRLLGLLQTPDRSKSVLADERGWWLANLLEGAALRAEGTEIDLATLNAEATVLLPPVSPFAITRAIADGNLAEAARQAFRFMQSADERDYFGLWGALDWQLSQPGIRLSSERVQQAKAWLGEVELDAKRGDLAPSWILHQFLTRLHDGRASLIDPRLLWLSQLPLV